MSYEQTQYLDFLDAVKNYYGTGSDQWISIAKYGLQADNALEILQQVPNVDILKNADGSIRSIAYKNYSTSGNRSTFLAESINSNVAGGSANVNKSFNMKIPSNTKVNETSKTLEMASEIGTKTTGQKVIGVLGTIGQAVLAVGTACTLGKTIDKALYNLNPDFWNAHDMETLNPDTWASITNSGSVGDNLFNLLMGVDPDTNETTAYIDENALAYMALYLQTKGIFDEASSTQIDYSKIPDTFDLLKGGAVPSDLSVSYINNYSIYTKDNDLGDRYDFNRLVPFISLKPDNSEIYTTIINTTVTNTPYMYIGSISRGKPPYPKYTPNRNSTTTSYNEYNYQDGGASYINIKKSTMYDIPKQYEYKTDIVKDRYNSLRAQIICALLYFGINISEPTISGVGSQDGATIPDLSEANSISDVLNILKKTLPNIFNNAITNSVPQPDGSIKDYTYVPISLPNTNNNNDAQPETGGQTQQKPQVNPDTSPDTLLDLITKLIGNKLDTPNTPNTGTGETPPSVLPTGSASALYKIYNPSQSEIDSFGAWLWSSNFVDQLLKVFNNPMESIIGLHKVYASPVIGGKTNIKVGYLDSGVNSNYVSNQYTKIDCGTVNLQEYFGNVFDYSPYTNIELYLPCIGFVSLNVGDVMRSSLNITYTVDVLTGACLAEVKVIRDSAGGVLYSYSGNCASQYPLSSGSYMGIVSSAIGVAGSIIGTVASGGSLAPLALGSIGSALNTHTSVQHSGNLSGNSGVMGGKIPYLIISRPQTNMAENYQHLQGIPSNTYVKLSSCHGFTQVKNVNVENINAESSELDEIKTQLMNGVLI